MATVARAVQKGQWMMAEQSWRPMAEFDPSEPAIVHDKLNDKTIDWRSELLPRALSGQLHAL
jgi:hypothetical protein